MKPSTGKEIAAAVFVMTGLVCMIITIVLEIFFPPHCAEAFTNFVMQSVADVFIYAYFILVAGVVIAVLSHY